MSRRHRIPLAALAFAAVAAPADAQQRVTAGLTAASFDWKDGRSEQAIGLVVQAAPAPWLVLGAIPTALRARSFEGEEARMGLADLPAYAGVTHAFDAPGRPTLAVAGVASLPTGDADRGLGRGEMLVSGEATLAIAPLPRVTMRGGGARLLRDGGLLADGAPRTTLFGDAVLAIGARTNVGAGYAADVGDAARAPSGLARAVNASLVRTLAGSTALLASGARTLRGAGPAWSLAIGIGTAFGGVSPLGATSVRGRAPTGTSPRSGAGDALGTLGGAPLCTLTAGC